MGRKQTLHAPEKIAAFSDLARQGYPFYGGNITYKIPFKSEGKRVTVRASMFRSPVMKVAVDGQEKD